MKAQATDLQKALWILCIQGFLVGCSEAPTPTVPAPTQAAAQVPATEKNSLDAIILPQLDDVAPELGIVAPYFTDTVPGRYFLPEIMGGGATWLDFDQDGQLDLYLTNGSQLEPGNPPKFYGNRLYRGRVAATFLQVADSWAAADPGYGQGSAAGDFNSDGFPDLYVGNFGPNALYVNEGDGTFSRDTRAPEVDDPAWTSGVMWMDLNRDGWLDLYVTNYLKMTLADRKVCEYEKRPGYCGPGQYEAAPDHVYLNQGDGSFVESSASLGMTESVGKGLAVLGADLDNDQIPEIYVANDMTVNFMYQLQPGTPLTYADVAGVGGTAQSGEGMNEASMGIACADFDGDQRPDIYLTHYYNMQKTLYKNHGNLQFEDVSRRMRTAQTGYPFLGFGTVPIDFNGDGYQDLFVTNGHVLGPEVKPDRMTPQCLLNKGGKFFEDITPQLTGYFRKEWLGRGAASADFDNDGDLDIAVTHLDEPAAVLKNSTPTQVGFIGLDLRTSSRVVPCGTLATVTTSRGTQSRSVVIGGSYLSSSDPRLTIPVHSTDQIVEVKIEWSSGQVEQHTLTTNRYWHLMEGQQPW
jgi:hypothetical protein